MGTLYKGHSETRKKGRVDWARFCWVRKQVEVAGEKGAANLNRCMKEQNIRNY